MKIAWGDMTVIALIIGIVVYPIFGEVNNPILYYIITFSVIGWASYQRINKDKYEKKFYQKWHLARQQNYWLRVFYEACEIFIYILPVRIVADYILSGINPLEEFNSFSWLELISYILLHFLVSFVFGMVTYSGKEKRYYKIHNRLKNDERLT